jgi:molybdopterin molybdotransferase
MLTVEEYLERVLGLAEQLPAEPTPIGEGAGQVLASPIAARIPVPPFTNSAMDGFAVRSGDIAAAPVTLPVAADIPAGARKIPELQPGRAARIMTGAPLPPGADCVVPVELTDQPTGAAALPAAVRIGEPVPAGRHVRRVGEDAQIGEVVLPAGLGWTPAAASSAASLGYAEVPLIRRPRVAVLATGSELVAAGEPLGCGQIPDSNSVLLAGHCRGWGADVVLARAVDDDPDRFRAVLREALAADLVLTTGGVSVGAFEVVRQVVEGEVRFEKVAMQPGKPQACGLLSAPDGRLVPLLGLPGNPVSVFVSAWVFTRPLIAKLGGRPGEWPQLRLPALEGWGCPAGRQQFMPVAIRSDGIVPVHRLGWGSHLVASLALADGLAVIGAEVERVEPGDELMIYRTS